MKTIRIGKKITIEVPNSKIELACFFLYLAATYQVVKGNTPSAFDMLQTALLLEISTRLQPNTQASGGTSAAP